MGFGSLVLSGCTCLALICGLGLLGTGGFVLANIYAYMDLVDATIPYAIAGVMVLGAVVAVVNFLGCYGSCSKSRKMLTAFLVLKIVVFIVEVAVVVVALMYKDQIRNFASNVLNNGLKQYGTDQPITKLTDTVQAELHCCGVDGYKDWKDSPFSQGTNLPDTCCMAEHTGCGKDQLSKPVDPEVIYPEGCLVKFTNYITDKGIYIIGITIILIILELLTAVLTCMVCSRAKENYTV